MPPKIQLDMRLSRLIEAYSQTRSVFAAHGLGKLVDEENLPLIGPFLTLETALLGHGVAPENFLKLLAVRIRAAGDRTGRAQRAQCR